MVNQGVITRGEEVDLPIRPWGMSDTKVLIPRHRVAYPAERMSLVLPAFHNAKDFLKDSDQVEDRGSEDNGIYLRHSEDCLRVQQSLHSRRMRVGLMRHAKAGRER